MVDKDPEQTAEDPLTVAGRQLAKAREAAGMAVHEIASELHLRVEVIQAIEAGDEAALPAAAFVRGYVRSYARCVGLDEAALVAALPHAVEHRPRPRQGGRKYYRAPSIPLGRVLVWGLVLSLLVLVVLYGAPAIERLWSGQQGQPVDNTLQLPLSGLEEMPAGEVPAPPGGREEGAYGSPGASAQTVDEPAPVLPMARPEPVKPVKALSTSARTDSTGPAALTLRFSQDSWVEIKSRDRKLVVGTQHAGTQRTIRADPPIDILLGNAPAVAMSWRGKPFDITPYQRGKVARIKLEH